MENITLLLVDDEQEVLDEWRAQFQNKKYNILESKSGIDALKIVDKIMKKDELTILIVLLDIKMKGMNGIEVLKKIKGEYPLTPIFIITGNRETTEFQDTAFETGRYGGTEFIEKQKINFDKLIKNIEKAIEAKKVKLDILSHIKK